MGGWGVSFPKILINAIRAALLIDTRLLIWREK